MAVVLLILLLFPISFGFLSHEQKYHLLDLHNNARRAQSIPSMKLMVLIYYLYSCWYYLWPIVQIWYTPLAIEAESYSDECSTTSGSQDTLIKAVGNRFSWIGENIHIHSPSLNKVIDNSTLSQSFDCWLGGKDPCGNTQREQVRIYHI